MAMMNGETGDKGERTELIRRERERERERVRVSVCERERESKSVRERERERGGGGGERIGEEAIGKAMILTVTKPCL